jgi:hypothetical protein
MGLIVGQAFLGSITTFHEIQRNLGLSIYKLSRFQYCCSVILSTINHLYTRGLRKKNNISNQRELLYLHFWSALV